MRLGYLLSREVILAKFQVVSVFDSAVRGFGRPVFVPSVEVAVRSFKFEVNKGTDDDMCRVPSDFILYHLGEFDDELGTFLQLSAPAIVARAVDLVAPREV